MERRKLIEVSLPLEEINRAARRETAMRRGHPKALHQWWARRPLTAARAVLFAQMVDDPASWPEHFSTPEEQDAERQRLFGIIKRLIDWKNITNETVLNSARTEILRSWRRECVHARANAGIGASSILDRLPAFHDPFAGSGAIPLEAHRLGMEVYASDLNPVAVLINKAMIEIPPKFAGRPPVNPRAHGKRRLDFDEGWGGIRGLADDVRYYGRWLLGEAERQIGHLFPTLTIDEELVKERPDLRTYRGRELTVVAWLWARTVKSPNPAFADVDVPLVSSFVLSGKKGKAAYVQPVVEGRQYRFAVRPGIPPDLRAFRLGTQFKRNSSFRCLMSGSPMSFEYLREQGRLGRMGAKLMAVVACGDRGRVYVSPTSDMDRIARSASPINVPEGYLPDKALGFRVQQYGMVQWRDLFTSRQLVALTTFSDLVRVVRDRIVRDASHSNTDFPDDNRPLSEGGRGALGYAEAVSVYLAFAVSKTANRSSTICTFKTGVECPGDTFGRQAIQMSWDYAESNVLSGPSGSLKSMIDNTVAALVSTGAMTGLGGGLAYQADAKNAPRADCIFSTDPPYYDNIGYADLSDFFYVWLRRSLRSVFPELFATLGVPKADELVANPYRHGGKSGAERFFLEGMTKVIRRLRERTHDRYPITIYYAFKQEETKGGEGTTSTGWETFLHAVIAAGFSITGTWPVRTERENRKRNQGSNALASSIVLVCRRRPDNAPLATRREFLSGLRAELPEALRVLQSGNIAPVDLAQAAIGPSMAIYTRYGRVLDANGEPMKVREALAMINQILDESLAEQEGDFDSDTRWALAWFEERGFEEGEFGVAETLSKAKNTSVGRLVEAGILESRAGKVRLLRPSELASKWDPSSDARPTTWEMVHHLIRLLEISEEPAADLLRRLGSVADVARDLAYRLYSIAERKKRAAEALQYNSLVGSWPEIKRMASVEGPAEQTELL